MLATSGPANISYETPSKEKFKHSVAVPDKGKIPCYEPSLLHKVNCKF